MDVLLLPTTPTIYTVQAVTEEPVALNARLGHYTNFVNLLDCCAVAVPAGFTAQGLPFGVTLVAPAFADGHLAFAADQLHRQLEPSYGAFRRPLPRPATQPSCAARIEMAVVGAHLAGEPLHWQLTERGAQLVARTRTAACYRLYALANTTPPKPGLVRDPGHRGSGIEVEVWSLDAAGFGTFTALVPSPLAIGSVELNNGDWVKGFVCEPSALTGAEEITHLAGWRAYQKRRAP